MDQLETTDFRRWRFELNLSIKEAAEAIGTTDRMALYLDRGERKLTKRHQMLMDAKSKGYELRPWQG